MKKFLFVLIPVLILLGGVVVLFMTTAERNGNGTAESTSTGSPETTAESTTESVDEKEFSLRYDDRKDLTALLGVPVGTVEVTNQTVTSNKVGTEEKDTDVLVFKDGVLYAVGIGTATLTVDGVAYEVTVEPATLSLFLITGHSIGYGQEGNPAQSVAIEPGQAYSTWQRSSLVNANGGLGWGADKRVGGVGESGIDAFAKGGSGTQGVGSALAYRWNQTTGEKVWVMNLSVPGSALNEWLPGVMGWHMEQNGESRRKYAYKYEAVLEYYGYMQAVVANEIKAGHYTLGHQILFYFSGANFGLTGYTGATEEDMIRDYDIFWEGLKRDLTMDIDGDGKTETFEGLGIVPAYWPNNSGAGYDKTLNYYMAASEDYPDVFIASDICKNWLTAEGLATFPEPDYPTQGRATQKPDSVLHMFQGGTSAQSVFCDTDKVHLEQVSYNAIGLDMASGLAAYLEANEKS